MDKLRVVSIGGFGHAFFVFDDMLDTPEAELVAVAKAYNGEDIDGLKSHKIFNKNVAVYDDYKKMLSETKADVAIVNTRLDKIPGVIIDAANVGCHIISEKPLAIDSGKLRAVHGAVRKNGVKLMAMLSMRSLAPFRAAKKVYDSGVIGEAILANGRKSYKYGTRPQWFGQRDKYGGTIGWVGIHALDFINYITGLEFTSVAAMQGNFAHQHRKDCQDNCGLVLEMSNGGHATVSVDLLRPESAPSHGDDWVRIVGTNGLIEASTVKNNCTVLIEGQAAYEEPIGRQGKIFSQFLLSLLGKGACETAQDVSFMLTETCLCARRAADTAAIVKIEHGIWR